MMLNFSSPLKATLTLRPRHGFMGNGTQKCQRDTRGGERKESRMPTVRTPSLYRPKTCCWERRDQLRAIQLVSLRAGSWESQSLLASSASTQASVDPTCTQTHKDVVWARHHVTLGRSIQLWLVAFADFCFGSAPSKELGRRAQERIIIQHCCLTHTIV